MAPWLQRVSQWVDIFAKLAAVVAAFAAGTLVWLQWDRDRKELRAYVIVEGAIVQGVTAANEFVVGFDLVNMGQTPVYNLDFNLFIDRRPYPDIGRLEFTEFQHHAFFGKKLSNRGTRTRAFSREDLLSIRNGDGNPLYLIGRLDYEDVFGVQRETGFCFRYLGDRKGFVACDHPNMNYGT